MEHIQINFKNSFVERHLVNPSILKVYKIFYLIKEKKSFVERHLVNPSILKVYKIFYLIKENKKYKYIK
jgi:hypothetical protein